MSRAESNPETITRDHAIDLVRTELVKRAGDDSICKLAAEQNIFCRGMHRLTDGDLRRRFAWLDRKHPGLSRDELEALINEWQLARQEVSHLPTACDVQQREHDACRGWNDFSNAELAQFCQELTGRSVVVN